MAYNPKDHYFHKAKKEGFLARSAYKLDEIQKRFKLLRKGDMILDLGCAPGSWSQVALQLVGPSGRVVGVDLKPVTLKAPNAQFIEGDILQLDPALFGNKPFDCIISDMAPSTTGIKLRDQAQSEELCRKGLELCQKFLKPGGHLVMKLFEGPDADALVREMQSHFKQVKRFKPQAVRKGSYETYVIGLEHRSRSS